MAVPETGGYREKGLLPLDSASGLEVALHFAAGGKLTGIDLLRLKPLSSMRDPTPTPALKALHLCMQPGTSVRPNRAWTELSVIHEGKTVWQIGLARELSPFQRRVYEQLLTIGAGETISYGGLAQLAGTAPRAVGQAMARNYLPVLIPCHRVISSDGGLGGFGSPEGVRIKERMLRCERESRF